MTLETAPRDWIRTDAEKVLEHNGYSVTRVLAVDIDSILFLDRRGEPRTAWIHRPPGHARILVKVVDGFQIQPPPEWAELLDRYR